MLGLRFVFLLFLFPILHLHPPLPEPHGGAGRAKSAKAAKVDVTNEQANEDLVRACVAEFGGLNIFFANAGTMSGVGPQLFTPKRDTSKGKVIDVFNTSRLY